MSLLAGWPDRPLREREVRAIEDVDGIAMVWPGSFIAAPGEEPEVVSLAIVAADWWGSVELLGDGWGWVARADRREALDDADHALAGLLTLREGRHAP